MEMARTLAEAYYQFMPPGRLGCDIGSVKDFLISDHFHLGATPAEHIRHLRNTICPDQSPGLADIKTATLGRGQRIIRQSHDTLQHLVRHSSGFRLTFVLSEQIWGPWTQGTLEVVRPFYVVAKQKGMRVRIYGHPDSNNYPILRIDGYYKLSAEDWHGFCEEQRGCRGENDAENPSDDDARSEDAYLHWESGEFRD